MAISLITAVTQIYGSLVLVRKGRKIEEFNADI